MAFSTQKEFFHVPFMNETVDYECRKACVKLKTYQSTIDHRSWAMDESLQSRFLSDLITCQTPVGGYGDGDGDDEYDYDYDGDETGEGARAPGRNLGSRRGGGRHKRGVGRPVHTDSGYIGEPGMRGDEGAGPSGRGRIGGPGGGGPGGSGPRGGGTGGGGPRGGGPGGGGPGGSGPGGGGPGSGPGGFSGGGGPGGGGPGGAFPGGADGRGAKLGQSGLLTADSVIACANEQMGRMQELLLHKKNLEKQLEVSNERLKVSNMENDKIKAIMNNKFDSSHSKDFYNKIQKLTSGGKISKGEENELLQIYNKFEDMSKAYEILQAENAYLKRLMEKLSLRASFEALKVEPEKSNDIAFLQNEVNKLRKELSILRKFEDDKLKGTMDSNRNKMSDQDAETLKAIIKERNALREKCKTFKDLEAKVYELQKIAKEADKMSDSLSNDLDSQSKHINKMEHEMKQMQDYYEDQIAKHKFNEDILRCQLDEMKEELIRARCSAQKAECLQMEISSLRNELMRRELALNDYNCQYNQLMNVIDELQHNAIQNLHDTQTQTCTDYMDDLTFFARATLNEIKKEIKKRGGDGDNIGGPAITDGLSPDECCAELQRLHDMVKQLTRQNEYLQNNVQKAAEDYCAEAFTKLREMEEKYKKSQDDISYLKKDKDALNMHAMDKLNEFSDRVDKMGTDVGKAVKDTAYMDKDLKESMKLVKEISDIQLKNVQLSNAVNALNTRDDQSNIDDLRRQLLEEQAKNKKCQEENKRLRELLEKRGIDPELATKDIVKEVADVQKGGPATGLDVQRSGPFIGPDGQKGTPSGASQLAGPDKGGPFVGKDIGPEAGKKFESGGGEVVGAEVVRKGGPGESAVVGPEAGKKAGPGVADIGGPSAVRKDALDTAGVKGPDAFKAPTPGRGPEATQPVAPGAVPGPAAAKTSGPAERGPGVGGPATGAPGAGSPAVGGPSPGGLPAGGPQKGVPITGGPGIGGPPAGSPGADPGTSGQPTGGPGTGATTGGPRTGPTTSGPGAGPALGGPAAGPGAGGPATDSPVGGGPAAGGPGPVGPAAGGPTAGGPAAGGPAADRPGAGPGRVGPAAGGPGTGDTTGGPGTDGPTGGGPGSGATTGGPKAGPAVGGPTAGGPGLGAPTPGGPDAGVPTAGGPAAAGPPAGGPAAGVPAAGDPGAIGPAARRPGAAGPGGGPAAGGPTTGGPGAVGPAAGIPGAGGPAAGGPTAGGPSAAGPAAGGPGAVGPAAGGPGAAGPIGGGPAAGGPATGGPATGGPGAVGPATGGPGAADPTRGGPAMGRPGAVGPAAGVPGADGTAAGGPGPGKGDIGRPGAIRIGEPVVGEGGGPGGYTGVIGPGGADQTRGPGEPDRSGPGLDKIGGAGPVGDGSAIGDGESGGRTGTKPGKGEGIGGSVPGRGPIGRGPPISGGGKSRRGKGAAATADSDAFQQFIDTNANTMISNIRAGSALEKELRAILNSFMMECGFCFCKSLVPKSKFYALCHKLLHNGIQCMSFRELAYMHRKIFMAADKLHPGCLLNMILTELGFKDGEGLKCCHCKNALCCSNSEEMLKEKVSKLERDIEMAKEYLDSLKGQPKTPKNPYTSTGKTYRNMEDSYTEAVEELLTCRETRPALSRTHSKQMKTLKARIMKCSEMLR
ncbi:uncharacterized protein LOC105226022 isoform X2 [Bactrocera dorsalis]|uniref:Uncharacterized protein LOC105226022 isoform X2 n=1 Tax=Bactrocera dorsalis TaxID=27457 RepID=A0ABM3J387_BACDO|nr:uncharacterized protein LOC105226022 isoform X2 [Bactrocera dorsalis]